MDNASDVWCYSILFLKCQLQPPNWFHNSLLCHSPWYGKNTGLLIYLITYQTLTLNPTQVTPSFLIIIILFWGIPLPQSWPVPGSMFLKLGQFSSEHQPQFVLNHIHLCGYWIRVCLPWTARSTLTESTWAHMSSSTTESLIYSRCLVFV